MKTRILLVSSLFLLGLCSCETKSKAAQVADEIKSATDEYVEDLNNAESLEEVELLNDRYHNKVHSENAKITREERREYEGNASLEDLQELKNLKPKSKSAYREARERFENQ